MLKNSMESIFTEDSYYQLASYGSGLQDAAGIIRFPLHCVAKAVCGHITKPFFPILRCQLAEEFCQEPLRSWPWLLVAHGFSLAWPLTVTSPTGWGQVGVMLVGGFLLLSPWIQGGAVCFRAQKFEATIWYPHPPTLCVWEVINHTPCFELAFPPAPVAFQITSSEGIAHELALEVCL